MKHLLLAAALFGCLTSAAETPWKPAGDRIKTRWAAEVDPAAPLPEYPRPTLVRSRWRNLNGLWNYSLTPAGAAAPGEAQGRILVPFPIESSLSGVQRGVTPQEALWYETTFEVPAAWRRGNDVLLHFGAVDWRAEVYVNDLLVGSHTGGYTPFSFDITPALSAKGVQKLTVKVTDSTDKGFQPHGKQVLEPHGIWYTPVTGIWQTVWIEPVPAANHIAGITTRSDIRAGVLSVDVKTARTGSDRVCVTLSADGKTLAERSSMAGQPVHLAVEHPRLWSPDDPYLYDLTVTLVRDGRVIDRAESYAALREIATGRDANGIERMTLNGRPLFHFGPLDQGWWPDGLYTAATDEALEYDVIKTKDFGFNMIRKHVKVEPARWYTFCDRHGIMVWQDMPSGDGGPQWQMKQYFDGAEWKRGAESEANYRKEWKEIMDYLYSNPCIAVWVPFNEAWGQFKTHEIAEWTKTYDPTRSVNPASGGNHYTSCGDILDLHNYPQPELYLYDTKRVTVLGEYGGIGYAVDGHLWVPDRNWGYVQFKSPEEVTDAYLKYTGMLKDMIKRGFSAGVYTQTSDVEIEVNGLMTYDRKLIKVDEAKISALNKAICKSLDK